MPPPARLQATNNDNTQNIFEVNAGVGADQTVFRDNSGNTIILVDSTGGTLSVQRAWTSSAVLSVTSTLDSTTTSSGALRITGGAGIGGSLTLGGQIYTQSTIDATALGVGSLRTDGGLSVALQSRFGGVLYALAGIDANSQRIMNLGTPTASFDAATKQYVDSVAQGLDPKGSVRVATLGPVTLNTGVITGASIDGYTLAEGDRVLVKDQSNPIENGIYIVQAANAPPVRSLDMQSGQGVAGAFFFVERGTVNGDNGWVVTNNVPNDVVGTDGLTFIQFSGAGQIIAGAGLLKTGNTLDVTTDNLTLEIFNDQVRIAGTAAGTGLLGGGGSALSVNTDLSHVTKLGTIDTGVWNASTVTVPYGGTGLTSLATGRIPYGNGTGALSSDALFTYTTSTLIAPNATFSGLLTLGGNTSTPLRENGNFLSLSTGYTLTDTATPATTLVPSWNVNYLGNSTLTATNSGVVVAQSATLTIDGSPIAGSNITLQDNHALLVKGGTVNLTSTNVSTSATTGALQVVGGIGSGGDIYIAGNMTSQGATGGTLVLNNTNNSRGIIQGPTPSNSLYLGANFAGTTNKVALYSFDGIEFYTGGLVNTQTRRLLIEETGVITVHSTIESASPTSGALLVTGGIGVSASSTFGSTLKITDTTQATTTTSAALMVAGGVGIAKSLYIGGNAVMTNTTVGIIQNATDGVMISRSYDTYTSGAYNGAGRYGMLMDNTQGRLRLTMPTTASKFITMTTMNADSTVAATWFELRSDDGRLRLYGTADSNSTSTGTLIVSGGVSVAKSLFVGGTVSNTGMTTTRTGGATTASFTVDNGDTLVISNSAGGITLNATGPITSSSSATSTFAGQVTTTRLVSGSTYTGTPLVGQYLAVQSALGTLTQDTTNFATINFDATTIAGDTAGRAVTNASTLRITGAPIQGTNASVGSTFAFRIESGAFNSQDATDATSPTSTLASISTAGGIAVAKTLYATNIMTPPASTTTNTIGSITLYRAGNINYLQSGNDTNTGGTFSPLVISAPGSTTARLTINTDTVQVNYTTDATSAVTGAMNIQGGVSIQKTLYSGGKFLVAPTGTYYNTNPAMVISNGTTFQNLGTGALLLRVFEQADMTTGSLGSFTGRQILQTTALTVDYTSPTWPLNDGTSNTTTGPFAAMFTGYIKAQYIETYTFYLTVQDGARLYVNGQLVVDAYTYQATPTVFQGTYSFTSTTRWIPIYIEWAATTSDNRLLLEWSSSSQVRQTVPAASFAYSGNETASVTFGRIFVQGRATFSSSMQFSSTTDTTSSANSGALQIAGGASISKSVFVGNEIQQTNYRQYYGGPSTTTLFQQATSTGIGGTTYSLLPPATTTQSALYRAYSAYNTASPGNNARMEIGWDETVYRIWSVASGTEQDVSISIGMSSVGAGKLIANTDGTFSITSTQPAISSSTGALIVTGGISTNDSSYLASVSASDLTNRGFTFTLGSGDQITRGDSGLSRALVKTTGNILTINQGGDFTGGIILDSSTNISSATISTSPTTGALTVTGGVGIGGRLSVSGPISITDGRIAHGTSVPSGTTDFGLYSNTASATVRFVSNAGTFRWYHDGNGGTSSTLSLTSTLLSSSANVAITETSEAVSSADGGSFTTAGGGAFAKSLYVGGNLITTGASSLSTLTVTSTTNSASSTNGGALTVSGGQAVAKDLWVGGVLRPNASINFQGTQPIIAFPSNSFNPPTTTTRSIGVKLLLFPDLSPTQTDYAIGVGSLTLWSGVPSSIQDHVWYASTNEIFRVKGTGEIVSTGSNTRFDLKGTNGSTGSIRIAPNTANGETAIGFHRDNTFGLSGQGDHWVIGRNSWGAGTGNLGIGCSVTGAVVTMGSGGTVVVVGTADSVSSTTGVLRVSGGAGVAKALYVGTTITAGGDVTLANNTSLKFLNASAVSKTIINVSASNDLRIYNAGGSNFYLNPDSITNTPTLVNYNTSANTVLYYGTTPMLTVSSTGVSFQGGNTTNSGTLTLTDTTEPTSAVAQDGALNVAGGVAVAKSIYAGTGLKVPVQSGGNKQITLTGTSTNATIDMETNLSITTTAQLVLDNSSTLITSTLESASTSSGALQISGGASIGKSLYVATKSIVGTYKTLTTSITNASTSLREWFYLGRINTTTGSVTGESGNVTLTIYNGLDTTTSTTAPTKVILSARTDTSSALTARHQFVGLHPTTDMATATNAVIYTDGSGNYHLFVRASTSAQVQLQIKMSTNTAVDMSPRSEGTGTTPSGTFSEYTGTWTQAYTTATSPTSTLQVGQAQIHSTMDSTTSTNGGAFTVSGGLSVAKTLRVGTKVETPSIDTNAPSTPLTLSIGGTEKLRLDTGGNVILTATTTPTTTNTYDLGTASSRWRNLFLSGTIAVSNNTASTNTTSGALTVAGGVGIVGDLNVGGKIAFGASIMNDGFKGITPNANYITLEKAGTNTWYVWDNLEVENVLTLNGGTNATGGPGGTLTATSGLHMVTAPLSFQDRTTAASGTTAGTSSIYLTPPTLSAQNTGVTITSASTLTIAGAPSAGTNATITNSYALNVPTGRVNFGDTRDASASTTSGFVVAGGMNVAKTVQANKFSLPTADGTDVAEIYSAISGAQTTMTFKVGDDATASNEDGFAFVHNLFGTGDKTVASILRNLVTLNSSTTITDATDSTSPSTGSFTTSGGMGVAKALSVGTTISYGTGGSTLSAPNTNDTLLASGGGNVILRYGADANKRIALTTSTVQLGYDASNTRGWTEIDHTTGNTIVYSTTQSASTTSGALQVKGGLAVTKATYTQDQIVVNRAGGGSRAGGITVSYNTASWSPDTDVLDANRHMTLSSATTNHAVTMSLRNTSFTTSFWDITAESAGNNRLAFTSVGTTSKTYFTMQASDGITNFLSTTDASSTTSGALTLSGGVAVAKKLYIGGDAFIDQNLVGGTTLQVRNASANAGSWSQMVLRNDTSNTASIIYNSSARAVEGGSGAMTIRNDGGDLRLLSGGQVGITLAQTTGNVNITNGTLTLSNANQSTSLSTGSIVTAGGVAIGKDTHIGGTMSLYGSTSGYTTLKASPTTTTYTVTLPATLPLTSGATLTSDLSGNLVWGTPLPPETSPSGTIYQTFNAANGQSSPANVNGLSFNGGSFVVYVDVIVTATVDLRAQYELRGVLKPTGWSFTPSYIGDDTQVIFSITSQGQIQYTTPTTTGWTSTVFQWEQAVTSTSSINRINVGEDMSGSVALTEGAFLTVNGAIFTDGDTVTGGTRSQWTGTTFQAPTLAGGATNTTTTNVATVHIENAPIEGDNETFTNAFALWVEEGATRTSDTTNATGALTGALQVAGGASISKDLHVIGNTHATGTTTLGGGDSIGTVLFGTIVVGTSASNNVEVSVTFSKTLSTTNYSITGSLRTTSATTNSYAVTFISCSTTGCTAVIRRLDTDAGWGDANLMLAYQLMV